MLMALDEAALRTLHSRVRMADLALGKYLAVSNPALSNQTLAALEALLLATGPLWDCFRTGDALDVKSASGTVIPTSNTRVTNRFITATVPADYSLVRNNQQVAAPVLGVNVAGLVTFTVANGLVVGLGLS